MTTIPPKHVSYSFSDVDNFSLFERIGDIRQSTDSTPQGKTLDVLELHQPQDKAERETCSVSLPRFEVMPGFWDVSYMLKCDLPSADSSYNGTVWLEVFDDAGERIERKEVEIIHGQKPWKASRQRIEIVDGAAQARFTFSIQKTYGQFNISNVAAEYAGPSLATVTAITFASQAVGNLFYPDQPLRFTVGTRNKKSRPQAKRVVDVVVCDYWGAEYASRRVELTEESTDDKGRIIYSGTMELEPSDFELGRYYELRGSIVEPEMDEPTRDDSSFAILPEAPSRQYAPFDIPFTGSCWNPNQNGVFPLMDRIGLRVTNLYSRSEPQPPYNINQLPNVNEVEDLGMGALITTSMPNVERSRPGWSEDECNVEEALYQGTQNIVNYYKAKFPVAVRVGNEPHPKDEEDAKRMIRGYKAVYNAVKDIDPSITVTATSCGAEEVFFKNGYQDFHDCYIFHQYKDHQTITGDFKKYDAMVEKYGKRKPVWSTELGINSQGMSRGAVASEMYKILTNFFAAGGKNASWFGIMWPDMEAKLVGTNGDSFDIFNSKYCHYSPKMTAISEYHFINNLLVKEIVEQKQYADGNVLTLFRDAHGKCLIMGWNCARTTYVNLPLPDGVAVSLTRYDGAMKQYQPDNASLNLTIAGEPTMLVFDGPEYALPDTLGESHLTVQGEWGPVVKGCEIDVTLAANDPAMAEGVCLQLPPSWEQRKRVDGKHVTFTLKAPEATHARSARIIVTMSGDAGELQLPLEVESVLDVSFVPAARNDQGAGMRVRMLNRSMSPQALEWDISIPDQFPMDNGVFALKAPVPFKPEFIQAPSGTLTLKPGESKTWDVYASNLDPITLYQTKLQWRVDGVSDSIQRYMGGCVGVPKVKGRVTFDGKMGDPAWKDAVVLPMDNPQQFCYLNKRTASWNGPEDLSADMHLMWDDDYLYIGMKVIDDVHCQPEINHFIWRGDGLQMLIDPCRGGGEKQGKYDYTAALTRLGEQAWCGTTADAAKAPSNLVEDFKLNITPTGEQGNMIYELGIPWHRVSPFTPEVGGNLGLAMIVNNDDGNIRDSFMAWFGCAHSKQLDMAGDLILLGD